ncbi:hypothetical protein AAT19DRAFT_11616 [Rhodotorula toruloides]|uniref:Uncharacterized protein n=1 Tax=Rhodotorula toruloides TaxID=5286 RepID=A0A2S9ZW64_RHOTO|nr:hypothetical protein AAT19DRAFT_11616 [Rhodotorula toruloides]
MRMGETFSTRRMLDYLLAGTWLFLADSLFCAGVLVYELVYKRRNELAKSSLVQQFTALALKTSLVIVIFVLIGAIAITHAFVYGSLVSGQVSLAMGNLFSFASCCCVAICAFPSPPCPSSSRSANASQLSQHSSNAPRSATNTPKAPRAMRPATLAHQPPTPTHPCPLIDLSRLHSAASILGRRASRSCRTGVRRRSGARRRRVGALLRYETRPARSRSTYGCLDESPQWTTWSSNRRSGSSNPVDPGTSFVRRARVLCGAVEQVRRRA